MGQKKKKPSYLERVNRTEVPPELLGEVMSMHADMTPEDRQVHDLRLLHMFELLKAKGLKGKTHADLSLAIDFRLTALARLLDEHDVRGWTLPAKNGAEYVHFDVLRVAAAEPMVETPDRQAGFDPDTFRLRVLEVAAPKGAA